MKIKKETVKILVRVRIEYAADNAKSRAKAINKAKGCVTDVSIYSYPISVYPVSAKEIK